MNLLDLRRSNPKAFRKQDWYVGERFARRELTGGAPITMPVCVTNLGLVPYRPADVESLPWAVEMVNLYLRHPRHPMWKYYLWCRDVDSRAQRIYVGGTANNDAGQLEIHRHLNITRQFASPSW